MEPIGRAWIRVFWGMLGIWCAVGPFLPYAILMESRPVLGAVLGGLLAVGICGIIWWKYTHGSAGRIQAIVKDALILGGVTGIAAAAWGFLINGLFRSDLDLAGWVYLLIGWAWFWRLEFNKSKRLERKADSLPDKAEVDTAQQLMNEPTVGEDNTVPSQTKQCPFCSETIQATAIKCRYCGEWLEKDRAQRLGILERLGRLAGGDNWRARFSGFHNTPEGNLIAGYLLILTGLLSLVLWLLTLASPNLNAFLALSPGSAITAATAAGPLTLGFFLLRGKKWARKSYLWVGGFLVVWIIYKVRAGSAVIDDWFNIGYVLAICSLLLHRGSPRTAKILGSACSVALLLLFGVILFLTVWGPLGEDGPLPDVSYSNSEYGIEVSQFPPGWSVAAKNKDSKGTFKLLELRKAFGDLQIYLFAEKIITEPKSHASAVRDIFSASFRIPTNTPVRRATYGKLEGAEFLAEGFAEGAAITIAAFIFKNEINQFRLVCYGKTKNRALVSQELAAFAQKFVFFGDRRPGVERIVEYYKPLVVTILAGNNIQGTGFFVDADGSILTNAHVVTTPGPLRVLVSDGSEFPAKRIYQNLALDVALIRVGVDVNWLPVWGRVADIKQGEEVMVVGSPGGLAGSVTKGIVSSVWQLRGKTYVQTDASLSPGASGSPLIDRRGRLIGIIFSKISEGGSAGLGFALSVDDLMALFPSLGRVP